MYDLIINNGKVLNSTDSNAYRADLAIKSPAFSQIWPKAMRHDKDAVDTVCDMIMHEKNACPLLFLLV